MSAFSPERITTDITVGKNSFGGVVDGVQTTNGYSFYRGEHTNFGPNADQLGQPDAVQKFVLSGYMPREPFIDGDTTIIAFGSCFANNISTYLNNLGFNVATKRDETAYVSRLGDGIVNTFAIKQQFDWAWKNITPKSDLWHGYKAKEFGYDEAVRLKTKELFDSADVFIITLGLSEIWYDEPTGEVFWRAVPADKFDPSRHKFRLAEYEESLENLRGIYDMIREHRPEARIVFTVSPIALAATFRPVSCITANAVSKAILRAAVDRLFREKSPTDDQLFYFPSYEIVLECFRHQFGGDRRHVHPHVLDLNMKAFERYFCKTGMTDEQFNATFVEALALDRELGGEDKSAAIGRITRDRARKRRLPTAIQSRARNEASTAQRAAKAEDRAKRADEAKAKAEEREAKSALRAERVASQSARMKERPTAEDRAAASALRAEERDAKAALRSERTATRSERVDRGPSAEEREAKAALRSERAAKRDERVSRGPSAEERESKVALRTERASRRRPGSLNAA